MSILTPRSNTSTYTRTNELKQYNGITSLATMKTIITLFPNKVNCRTPENTPQLPPHILSNTLMANPRQLNPQIPNPVRGSHNMKNPKQNFTSKRTWKNKWSRDSQPPPPQRMQDKGIDLSHRRSLSLVPNLSLMAKQAQKKPLRVLLPMWHRVPKCRGNSGFV